MLSDPIVWSNTPVQSGAVDREGQHVRRALFAAMLCVQLRDPLLVDVLDRQMTVLDPDRRGRQHAQAPHLSRQGRVGSEIRAKDLHFEHRCGEAQARRRSAARSSGASRWECSS